MSMPPLSGGSNRALSIPQAPPPDEAEGDNPVEVN
jgi:hypothetical protein